MFPSSLQDRYGSVFWSGCADLCPRTFGSEEFPLVLLHASAAGELRALISLLCCSFLKSCFNSILIQDKTDKGDEGMGFTLGSSASGNENNLL